ncbi:HHE domain protein [Xylariaceae sp. FL0594]|nr:HHE domain protein [Xylariaceae sp. FL0594]
MFATSRYVRAVPISSIASKAFIKPAATINNPRLFSSTSAAMTLISDSIKHDHAELKQYYENIKNAKTNDEKDQWRNQFTWELARHSIGEELVVYPAMERVLPNGKAMADKDRKEHLVVKNDLATFQNMAVEDGNFEKVLEALWTNLSAHIKEEEHDDLPALEKALDPKDSESMTKSFGRTKMFIPTRSHPHAPDKPPFETVVGLLTAPIDHIRDLFRKFPEETKSQLPP